MTTEEILRLVSIVILALCVVGFILILTLGRKKSQSKEVVFAAVCIAMSFVLSFIKVKMGADGGSVTLASFVPLLIYSYVAGVRKGFLVGTLYGILQIVEGGVYFVDVFQLICDYILAFAFIGLMPVLKYICKDKKILGVYLGVVVVIFMRFLMHTIAGMYWYAGVPFGEALVASVLYNGTYMLPELAITVAVMAVLVHTKRFSYLTDYIKNAITVEK